MQAIVTKYLGPTNFRGSRVKATCQAKSMTVSWDDALGSDDNHDIAARMLAESLGWTKDHHGTLVGGGLPDGTGNCYVFVKQPSDTDVAKLVLEWASTPGDHGGNPYCKPFVRAARELLGDSK